MVKDMELRDRIIKRMTGVPERTVITYEWFKDQCEIKKELSARRRFEELKALLGEYLHQRDKYYEVTKTIDLSYEEFVRRWRVVRSGEKEKAEEQHRKEEERVRETYTQGFGLGKRKDDSNKTN